MVSPHLPASFACTSHDRHELFARTCVVAYWRCMSTRDRQALWHRTDNSEDARFVGGTVLEHSEKLGRLIGIEDLVNAFEGDRETEFVWKPSELGAAHRPDFEEKAVRPPWKHGWGMALLEMLLDPILVRWVPEPVVEQYVRWNPYFAQVLREMRPQRRVGAASALAAATTNAQRRSILVVYQRCVPAMLLCATILP